MFVVDDEPGKIKEAVIVINFQLFNTNIVGVDITPAMGKVTTV